MAAPVVSGVAALMLQLHPDWTPDQVKGTILGTRRQLPGAVEEVDAQAATTQTAPATANTTGRARQRPDRSDHRRHRLRAFELEPLELEHRAGCAGRGLGAVELELRVRAGHERRGGRHPVELEPLLMVNEVVVLR